MQVTISELLLYGFSFDLNDIQPEAIISDVFREITVHYSDDCTEETDVQKVHTKEILS